MASFRLATLRKISHHWYSATSIANIDRVSSISLPLCIIPTFYTAGEMYLPESAFVECTSEFILREFHLVDFQVKSSRSLITGIFILLERSAFDLCMYYTCADMFF